MHWIYAHLIGDFLLQNDWMAKGKKESWTIAVIHGLVYMIPFYFVHPSWGQFTLIALQHMYQDHFDFVKWLMIKKGSAKFAEPPMAPWSIIITDNILHILWIAFVMHLSI